jgi:Ran GTPase-activating protein (RanGAP) involved in mRNA processing and transport
LNISRNRVSNESCLELKDYLVENTELNEIYLQWNQIDSRGGKFIGEALMKNYKLKVIDLSFNSLGLKGSCIE